MIYAPKQRLNAAEALVHEFFDELRNQLTFDALQNQYKLPDLFDFNPCILLSLLIFFRIIERKLTSLWSISALMVQLNSLNLFLIVIN